MSSVFSKLEMERTEDTFCLLLAVPVKLTMCDLCMRRLHVNPTLQNARTEALLRDERFTYPFTWVKTQLLTLPSGVQQHTLKVDESRQLPQRLFIGFLKHCFRQSPLNIRPLASTRCRWSSTASPRTRLPAQICGRVWSHEYMHLVESCDKGERNEDN